MRLNETKVKSLARARGLGVKELLARARISPTAYYSLTRKDNLLPKSISKLARFLDVSVSKLLVDEEALVAKRLEVERLASSLAAKHAKANREDILHTLLLLELNPLDRLNRALLRGRQINFH